MVISALTLLKVNTERKKNSHAIIKISLDDESPELRLFYYKVNNFSQIL